MEGIVRAMTEHPLVVMAVCFAALLLIYFLFKSMIKLALILILVAILIGGYLYFQHPEWRQTNLKDTVEKVRTEAGKVVDQGKDAYEKSRELIEKRKEIYEKGKELVDKGRAVLDKGIDKGIDSGKDAMEKGKETAGGLGKILGGDGDVGSRQKQ